MTTRNMALIWAAIIILAAILVVGMNLNNSASFGILSGLSGAAWGSLVTHGACGKACLQ